MLSLPGIVRYTDHCRRGTLHQSRSRGDAEFRLLSVITYSCHYKEIIRVIDFTVDGHGVTLDRFLIKPNFLKQKYNCVFVKSCSILCLKPKWWTLAAHR